ncbi:MAG: KPN_02809 family neutral zinc metallopeptidase [Cecembia sp.]
MKWQGRRQSNNIEDRRGQRPQNFSGGGINPVLLGPLLKILFSKTGLVIVGVLLLFSFLTGTNPLALIAQFTGGGNLASSVTAPYQPTPEEERMAEFTAVVLADTEDVWNELMPGYREPVLVLFSGQVNSACGFASAASGPFYCPADEKVYIDLSFFRDMGQKLGAHGEFAWAYVIAHEVGHHVQKLNGTLAQVQSKRGKIPEPEYNRLMVRLELQADFYAGLWAHHTQRMKGVIEPRDIEEAMNAAAAVGDDRLQKRATGRIVPDSFTHGTSEQRSRWFKRGFQYGEIDMGDTFNTREL